MVDKAVGAGGADGLFVKVHGIERAAVEAGEVRAPQRRAGLKILPTILRPHLVLLLVSSQRLDMLLSRVVRCRIKGRSSRECTIKVILGRFEEGGRRPEQPFGMQ